jgi:hypothetical protein
MPEILTESFCERCGTRYTFESSAPRAARLKGVKVLSRGLKNFVLSDDTSMDEAMAAARSETDREVTSHQLDAFHKTFNFCMSCRQYTCSNCWNEAEGRCLSCAPHLGREIMPAPFPDLDSAGGVPLGAAAVATDGNGHGPHESGDALAWPSMDLDRAADDDGGIEPIDAAARLAFLGAVDDAVEAEGLAEAGDEPVVLAGAEAEVRSEALGDVETETDAAGEPELDLAAAPTDAAQAEALAEPETLAGPDGASITEPRDVAAEPVAAEPVAAEPVAAEPVVAAEPEPVDIPSMDVAAGPDDRAAAAATQTNELMRRFRPGQNLDDEIAAYEREQAAAAGAAAVDAPAPAEVPATPSEPTPAEPAVAAERVDVVEQPTWRIVAPEAPEVAPPPPAADAPTVDPLAAQAVAPPAEPQWPSQPEWPSQRPAGGLPFLSRPPAPTGGMEALWAESAREVASPTLPAGAVAKPAGGVQPCVSCGLSLSGTARFCRRCGTRQG